MLAIFSRVHGYVFCIRVSLGKLVIFRGWQMACAGYIIGGGAEKNMAEILNFPGVPPWVEPDPLVPAAAVKRICSNPSCQAEIVYGDASGPNKDGEYLCTPCANVWNSGHDHYGNYEPPAFFPVRQPGHC